VPFSYLERMVIMRFEFLNRQTIASFRVDGFVRIPEILSGPALQDLQQATATAAAAATAAAGEFLLVDSGRFVRIEPFQRSEWGDLPV
jgi:hypothetical protein